MGDSSSYIKIGPAGKGAMTESDISEFYRNLYAQDDYCDYDEFLEFDGGEAWDEKGRSRIAQIYIWHNNNGIKSIQFQYVDRVNGADRLVMSDRHGTSNGTKFDVVKLDWQTNDEKITWIRGLTSSNILCSITFGTNCKRYGPFGKRSRGNDIYCEKFDLQIGDGNEFAGFHGAINKSNGVSGIGFYLNPITTVAVNNGDRKP